MQLTFAPELKAFREESTDWQNQQLSGPFRAIRGQPNIISEHGLDMPRKPRDK